MGQKKISFVFYRSWVDAIAELDGETAKAVLLDIAHYALDETEPDFGAKNDTCSVLRRAIFGMARGILENDRKKHEEVCERNRKIAQEREAKRKQYKDTVRNDSLPRVTDTESDPESENENGGDTDSGSEKETDSETGSGAEAVSERGCERGAGGTGENSRTYEQKTKEIKGWASMNTEERNDFLAGK